jgi:hypothetical protein
MEGKTLRLDVHQPKASLGATQAEVVPRWGREEWDHIFADRALYLLDPSLGRSVNGHDVPKAREQQRVSNGASAQD